MMRMLKFGSVATAAILMASAAHAETKYSLQMPLLTHAGESSSTKVDGGDEVETKSTTLTTADQAGAYLAIFIDDASIYVYPLADLKLVSLSYWLGEIEIGVNLGLNSTKVDKPKDELSSTAFGVFFGYTLPVTPDKLNGEFYLIADNVTEKGTKEVDGTDVKTNTTTGTVKLSADAVVSINKQVSYLAGISYTTTNTEDKESKEKTKAGAFGLNLATLRLSF